MCVYVWLGEFREALVGSFPVALIRLQSDVYLMYCTQGDLVRLVVDGGMPPPPPTHPTTCAKLITLLHHKNLSVQVLL